MICPKCNRKYEDDMSKCLWCDTPNPNFGKGPTSGQESNQDKELIPEDGNQEQKPKKGTLIFWMGALFGELGIHCFMSGRHLRGCLYLFFGGFVFGFFQGFFGAFGVRFPAGLHFVMGIISIVVAILACIDLWKISSGKYTNIRTGARYIGKPWMYVFAVLIYIIVGLIILGSLTTKMQKGFLNPESYETKTPAQQYIDDGEKIATAIEAYTLKQEQFFTNENRPGSFEEIGFEQNANQHFAVQDLGMGISIRYKSFLGCKNGSIWSYSTSIQEGKIVWYVTTPKDEKCKESFPKLYELKNNLEEQQTESSEQ